MSVHPCPAPDCARRVPNRLLMCAADWALVPDELQRAVYRAYRRGSRCRTKRRFAVGRPAGALIVVRRMAAV